jgi:DNA-binding response OmpR family regulator
VAAITVKELSPDEAESLILAFLETRGGEIVTEDEAERVLDWAEHARLDVILLDMVLRGAIGIDVREGEIVFTSRGEILPTGPA